MYSFTLDRLVGLAFLQILASWSKTEVNRQYGTEQVTLDKLITHSTQNHGGPLEQETDIQIVTEAEEGFDAKIWTGAYILSLQGLPAVDIVKKLQLHSED